MLVLVLGITSCDSPSTGPGTIRIHITGRKGVAGLNGEPCKRSVDLNEILKTFTVRDEDGTEIARRIVRGHDTTVREVGANGRRCVIRAVKTLGVQTGADYEVVADGESKTFRWPTEEFGCGMLESMRACFEYGDTLTVVIYARGWEPPSGSSSFRRWRP
jgi:hypothetical protein